ncbi:hypothetical protein [Pseudanabaena sp. UWO310]|uniref:hypothetical protein n=1 Tax=Pseudanabaena sp. UWO310 TaxID=2480795 RepID=UPI00115A4FAF|nr:hypothetical protein [Pseudanabaena sp. UWO310]TYQ30073.1 hypothetical protein PseudUWO310_10430 [Pseudanabaena sp. UWO310]
MKLRILTLFFISAFATFFAAIAHAQNIDLRLPTKRLHSLDELPKIFENKYELTNYLEDLSGITKFDDLGTNLSLGLTSKDIARMIAPHEDAELAIAVSTKAFPHRLNSYIVIACFARTKSEYNRVKAVTRRTCRKKDYGRDDVVYLGLIEYDPIKSKSNLIAKSLENQINWDFTTYKQFRSLDRLNIDHLPRGDYEHFDFAPFKISDAQTAFGLRVTHSEIYSGGHGYFEDLALFIVDNNRIVNIFSEPMYFNKNIAGAWNKNGTRQHSLYEDENVLVVLPSQTDGYYDLQIKSLHSDWQRAFFWNASQKRYLPFE